MLDEEYLPEEDQYWQISIHARYADWINDESDSRCSFDMDLEFDYDSETVFEVVYPQIITRFEQEYGDSVDQLQYYSPEDLTE